MEPWETHRRDIHLKSRSVPYGGELQAVRRTQIVHVQQSFHRVTDQVAGADFVLGAPQLRLMSRGLPADGVTCVGSSGPECGLAPQQRLGQGALEREPVPASIMLNREGRADLSPN